MDQAAPFAGIEIGGTKIQVVTGDEKGKIASRWRGSVDREKGGPGICRQIETALAELTAASKPSAIGIGFGGPVNWRTGIIKKSHHIEGWDGFDIVSWLRGLHGVPVAVDNDANVAALAEATCGVSAASNPVFYVTLGSGVGGGLVADGNIYHGAPPGEAEFGHIRLSRDGTIVESRCCGWAVDGRIREIIGREPHGKLARLVGNTSGGEAKFLGAALRENDPSAIRLIGEITDDLAFALSHVVHMVHPEVIVLGGGLSLLGEPLRKGVNDKLPGYVMHAMHPAPQVRIASLMEDVVPVGALRLAWQAVKNQS